MRKRWSALGVAVMAATWLGGCCHCLKPAAIDTRPLPPAITLEQQLEALNARASALPRLKATGGVEIQTIQEGKPHHDSADGMVLLEQVYADHSANVYMRATAVGQKVFELGRSEKEEWWVAYGKRAEGHVYPARARGALWQDDDSASGKGSGELLRADLIPQLLAITEIVPEPEERVVMRVDDLRGVNELLIEHVTTGQPAGGESGSGSGSTAIEREIVIDRRSGEVREVALFGPGGVILVHAVLDHYVAVEGGGGGVATMPRRIVIDQPATHLQVGLTLSGWTAPAKMNAVAFDAPDWEDMGITPTQGE